MPRDAPPTRDPAPATSVEYGASRWLARYATTLAARGRWGEASRLRATATAASLLADLLERLPQDPQPCPGHGAGVDALSLAVRHEHQLHARHHVEQVESSPRPRTSARCAPAETPAGSAARGRPARPGCADDGGKVRLVPGCSARRTTAPAARPMGSGAARRDWTTASARRARSVAAPTRARPSRHATRADRRRSTGSGHRRPSPRPGSGGRRAGRGR